ncbi:MAG: hypothetical protein WBO39_05575 [Ferruginibacter sp.]
MKSFLLLMICSITGISANAQLKATAVCPPFTVDIMAGTVNDLFAKSASGEIQERLPCFSETVEKDMDSKCAGVFYKDRDISFYTDRRYIEIGEKFKGKLSPALMGVSRNSLFNLLGHPKLKDTGWDAYQMGYGTLILYYNKAGKINKIQISSKTTDAIKLCE